MTRGSKRGPNSKKEYDGGDGSTAVVINRNDGTGLFTVPELLPFHAGSIRETETGDFNGDGVADSSSPAQPAFAATIPTRRHAS